MKASILALALCALLICSIAAQSETDIHPRWSIVGDWNVTHPSWTDVLTFRKDGTMTTRDQGTSGRWALAADAGTPLVVLRWDAFGTESFLMVDQNHFRGQIQPGSFMDMRRGDAANAGIR